MENNAQSDGVAEDESEESDGVGGGEDRNDVDKLKSIIREREAFCSPIPVLRIGQGEEDAGGWIGWENSSPVRGNGVVGEKERDRGGEGRVRHGAAGKGGRGGGGGEEVVGEGKSGGLTEEARG